MGGIRITTGLHKQVLLLQIQNPQRYNFRELFSTSKWKSKQEIKNSLPLKSFLAVRTEHSVIFSLWQTASRAPSFGISLSESYLNTWGEIC